MERVLVSSCLLGEPVRYDGTGALCGHPVLDRWRAEGRIVPFCPEIAGGLSAPRTPVELIQDDSGGTARAVGRNSEDVTEAFCAGAKMAAALCLKMGIRVAVLKERSPSCGTSTIYDGTFSGRLVPGQGLTTAALRARGIRVFSESQWEEAAACLGCQGAD